MNIIIPFKRKTKYEKTTKILLLLAFVALFVTAVCVFEGDTNITSVKVRENLKKNGKYTFKGCTGMTTIEWDAVNCTLDGSECLFANCGNVNKISTGKTVKTLPKAAFYYLTGLQEVTIPVNVEKISENLFRGRTKLSTVNYGGTKEQWKSVIEGAKKLEKRYKSILRFVQRRKLLWCLMASPQ